MVKKYLEAGKKYGATGVLALWVGVNHARVTDLESKLDDCYGDKQVVYRVAENHNSNSILLAVLPDKIKIKSEKK